MKIIEPYFEILDIPDGHDLLKKIEMAGRTCYKSEDKITESSSIEFCKKILASGHHSVIEHSGITVKFVCDRGVSHEIVRHRLASYSQESTRYANYSNKKFGSEITVIKPVFFEKNSEQYKLWENGMLNAENSYLSLINLGASPQEARSVLPNSLKTEIIVTCNVREWRHIFKLRCAPAAHPQMRELMLPLLAKFQQRIPILFDNIAE